MPGLPGKLTVFSPSKINLHLAVGNIRQDGFHNLESIFLAVDLADILHFSLCGDIDSLEMTIQGFDSKAAELIAAPQNNIISRAISLFKEKTGFDRGVNTVLEKRIPIGGGLGGGSSNAAATLLALNKLAGLPCSRQALLEMAESLGSDVPFFVHEIPAAWITGRGENIQPIEAPFISLVLVNPGFPSDTRTAFRLLDTYRDAHTEAQRHKDHGVLTSGFPSASSVPLRLCEIELGNDFLQVFPDKEKAVYNRIISELQEQGAAYANLSGAGSTCFGVFYDKKTALKAAENLRGSRDFSVFYCNIYNQSSVF